MIKWFLLALVVATVLLIWRHAVSAKRNLPRAGQIAPEFDLPDQHRRMRSLSGFRGGWLVLYFFPRAETPGWIEQAARFRDATRDLEALRASVCGISVDAADRLAQFAGKHDLPFTLLSDLGGVVAARYGSLLRLGFLKFAKRNTFLIDPQGKVARVYLGASPARNAADVVEHLKELQAWSGA